MSERGGLGRSIARGCLLPLIGGTLLGALAVWLWLQIAPTPPPVPIPEQTVTPSTPDRIVVLIVNETAGRPVGLWHWRPGSPGVACVASNDYWVNPPGRTLAEILTLAQAQGDMGWLASHAGSVETDCGNRPEDRAAVVIMMPADGLAALVDALGGVSVSDEQMDGPAVWWFVADEGLMPDEAQERQRQLWGALSAKIAGQPDPCPAIKHSYARLLAVPGDVDACRVLTGLLRQTPADISTP